MEPALRRALQMLRGVEAERRHVVCLTDGQSDDDNLEPVAANAVPNDR